MTSSREHPAGADPHAASPQGSTGRSKQLAWVSGPVGIVLASILFAAVGVAAGVVLGRQTPEPSGARLARLPASGAPGAPALSPRLQSLAREVEREDAPTQKLLEFAHLALDQQQFALAVPAYKRVLARDPKNVEALAHVGLILYSANHVDQALARIDQALRIDPKYAHAHWDRAYILYESKRDLAGAAKSLETFLTLMPQGQDTHRARALLAEIRRSDAPPKP